MRRLIFLLPFLVMCNEPLESLPGMVPDDWCLQTGVGAGGPPDEDRKPTPQGEMWRTDLSSDPWNCGACGHECNIVPRKGSNATNHCVEGTCVAECVEGYFDCDNKYNGCESLKPCR